MGSMLNKNKEIDYISEFLKKGFVDLNEEGFMEYDTNELDIYT